MYVCMYVCIYIYIYIYILFIFICTKNKNAARFYLHQRFGLNSAFRRISSSNSAINRILEQGANFVPVAAPLLCFKGFFYQI